MRLLRILLILSFTIIADDSSAQCNVVGDKKYGDCAGVNINVGGAQKPLQIVSGFKSVSGISGAFRVIKGGALNHSGISNGDITIENGGRAEISGMVNGAVIINGGYAKVTGSADAVILNSGSAFVSGSVGHVSGQVTFKSGAVVGGQPVMVDE